MWGSTWAAQTAWWRQQNGGAPRGATATRPFGNATVLALGTVRPTTDNTMGGLTSACVETTHTAPHSTDYGSTTVPDDSGNGAGAGEGQGQGGGLGPDRPTRRSGAWDVERRMLSECKRSSALGERAIG